MLAIEKKNDAMVTALLDHNADPNIQDKVRQGAHEDERGDEVRLPTHQRLASKRILVRVFVWKCWLLEVTLLLSSHLSAFWRPCE